MGVHDESCGEDSQQVSARGADGSLEESRRLTKIVRTKHTARKNSSYQYIFYYTFGSSFQVGYL